MNIDHFRALCELVPNPFCTASFDGHFLSVNPAFTRILGYTSDHLTTTPFIEFVHPDDKENTISEVGRLASCAVTSSFKNRFRTTSGQYRDLEWDAVADTSAGVMYAMARDVTDLNRAELKHSATAAQGRHLSDLGRVISLSPNIDEVYAQFAELLIDLVPSDRINISSIDLAKQSLTNVYVHGPGPSSLGAGATNKLENTTAATVVELGRGFRACGKDYLELAEQFPAEMANLQAGLKSTISMPLVADGRVIGVLNFRSTDPFAYTPEHLEIAEQIADQIAGSVRTAQLYDELKAGTLDLELVARIGRIISSSLDIDEVFSLFGEEVRKALQADRVTVNLVDTEDRTLTIAHSSGIVIEDEEWGTKSAVPLEGTIDEEAMRTLKPVVWDLLATDQKYHGLPAVIAAKKDSISALAAVPLAARDKVIGALAVASTRGTGFGERQLNLLQAVGDQIAGAIANSLLYDQVKMAEEMTRLSEEKVRSIVEVAAEGIVTFDEDGRIETANSSAENILGSEPGSLVGLNLFDFLLPQLGRGSKGNRPPIQVAQGRALGRAQAITVAMSGRRVDGTGFPVELSTSEFTLGGNRIFTGIFRDVTEREKAQAAIVRQAEANARTEEVAASRQRMVKTQETLRRDIAQQLHGTVQNRMIVVSNRLVELAGGPAADNELSSLSKMVIALIDEELRPMSHRLHPSILRRGLIPAVQTVAEMVEPAKTLTIDLDQVLERSERSDRNYIPYDVRLACYRVVEEAVTNILKHSSGTEVHIALAKEEEVLTVRVEDNGQGFDLTSVKDGIGLAGMRDFAEVSGGSCEVSSRPGHGTRVSARFPLPTRKQ